jgi:HD-like signal output (HDOD) protein/CheY-like chemotaxis protein
MMRIVFVDDEVNVLHAMRRALHCMRSDWDMEFVSSGPEALESLARSQADVIVSDMRMPGMDGWQLLEKVKALYPQTVRLVLSGYAEPGAIMRLVGTAHQYIAKPGESATLKAAIAQTLFMRRLLDSDELALLVGHVSSLPSVPAAFHDISSCLRRPSATVADAARIIARDVAMTANVMKLVNSAFFGVRRQVTSVDRAVAYLGLDTLTALVLGHGLFQSGAWSGTEALWEHSLRTASAARAIALHEQLPVMRTEEAFLTGMLHDVGRVVYATRGELSGSSPPGLTAEQLAKIDNMPDEQHVRVGAYLLALWGFPSHIVAAVALHDTPSRRADPGLDLTVLVHVADRMVNAGDNHSPNPEMLAIEPGLLDGLGLRDHLTQWWTAVNALSDERGEPQAVKVRAGSHGP